MKYQKSLVIFRRDLRLHDNTALNEALLQSEEVIPCFIFTKEQIENNPYRSDHALQFMIESLEDLSKELVESGGRLYLFYGEPEKVVLAIGADAVFVNRDYTPYSIKRDEKIRKVCLETGIEFRSFEDALIHPPEKSVKSGGDPYTVFTPYFRNASKLRVPKPAPKPAKNVSGRFFRGAIPCAEDVSVLDRVLPSRSSRLFVRGGRTEGGKHFSRIKHREGYEEERDVPSLDATSHLSAYLKFGVFSVREVYLAIANGFGPEHPLIRSLYWRDFFTGIALFFPHVFSGSFRPVYDGIRWEERGDGFTRWCEGRTGFPIVDAGMRQLNETGFMHNRVRMITASFLVKDLHVDWRRGERYFAQKLVDYDPAVNNGNWQWSAGTGCDAAPYFRIFNPWSQQQKFDPECLYIKTWVPELEQELPELLHDPDFRVGSGTYPPPMLDHAAEAARALALYKEVTLK